ncbi:MAG: hypothetical protein IPO26_17155 [Saprospiraceae bacterium]|nr:hypothetical protein [Saprospiraceae bacterium]
MIAHSFRRAASDMKVPAVVDEGGESMRLDTFAINSGTIAIRNVLNGLGMTEDPEITLPSEQFIIHKDNWVRAESPGMFIWSSKSGDFVQKDKSWEKLKILSEQKVSMYYLPTLVIS